jgi:iron complex outermembrane receptor protein
LNEFTFKTNAGTTFEYAGTLSPCGVTSCSGAPQWRMTWANSLFFNDARTSATLAIYYTSGVDNWSVGSGGIPGDCTSASILQYVDGTFTDCNSPAIWNVDLTVSHQFNNSVRAYVDLMNVFDIEPEIDVSSAYHIYAFNPAFGGPNIMGRFIRLGVRLDFE